VSGVSLESASSPRNLTTCHGEVPSPLVFSIPARLPRSEIAHRVKTPAFAGIRPSSSPLRISIVRVRNSVLGDATLLLVNNSVERK
jgi:hypothetical protein